MTDKIIKNNILFAEFLNGCKSKPSEVISCFSWLEKLTDKYTHNDNVIPIKELKFHSSWDWLMLICIKAHDDAIDMEYKAELIEDAISTMHIDKVYEAVIDFINWYNLI